MGGVDLLNVSNFRKPLSVALAALIGVGLLGARMRAAARTRSTFAFYLLAAGVMFLLSLGPEPTLFEVPVLYKPPYSWLMLAPGFEGVAPRAGTVRHGHGPRIGCRSGPGVASDHQRDCPRGAPGG